MSRFYRQKNILYNEEELVEKEQVRRGRRRGENNQTETKQLKIAGVKNRATIFFVLGKHACYELREGASVCGLGGGGGASVRAQGES